MEIHPYLVRWQAPEAQRCTHDEGDFWVFHFTDDQTPIRCDVISFHGVGVVEDVIGSCIDKRTGWHHDLRFDREQETFSASVTTANGKSIEGEVSLNPGIALLSAYLGALELEA